MALKLDEPVDKKPGDNIRSKDWNDVVKEVIRLDKDKLNLAGGNIAGPLNIAGAVGIGTDSPNQSLTIQAISPSMSLRTQTGHQLILGVNVIGAVGFILVNQDLKLQTGGGNAEMTIKANGSVGIGTAEPNRPLTIQGNKGTYLNVKANDGQIEFLMGADDAGGIVSTMTNHDLQLRAGTNDTKMTIKANGNVGIGTNNPTEARLVIDDVKGWNAGLALTGSSLAGVGLSIENKEANGHKYALFSGGSGNSGSVLGGFAIYDQTKSTYRLLIDADGKVGIGTTNPTHMLHVSSVTGIRQNYLYLSGSRGGSSLSYNAHRTPANNAWVFPDPTDIAITVEMDSERTGRFDIFATSLNAKTTWDRKFRFDCQTGAFFAKAGVNGTGADLAENYLSESKLEPGDVVCLSPHENVIVRSETSNDISLVGVISTNPGFLLNASIEETEDSGGLKKYPVALCGRIPCKVTDENGPIRRGDFLTPSSTPGHAMKADPIEINGQRFYRPGTIIGKALGSLDEPQGIIEIFISLR